MIALRQDVLRVMAAAIILICACIFSGGLRRRFRYESFEDIVMQPSDQSGALNLSKTYRLQNSSTKNCVTMPKTGSPTVKPCNLEFVDQNLTLDFDGENYTLKSVTGDECLFDNVAGKFGKEECVQSSRPDQHWIMNSNSIGTEGPIVNAITSRCLSDKSDTFSSTACDDSSSQKWKLLEQNL